MTVQGGAILTTIDVSLEKSMVEALSGNSIGNDCYTFYYDETGNCRKFYFKDRYVNSVEGLRHNFLGISEASFDKKITKYHTWQFVRCH